jgi:hypothetical protein
MGQDTASRGQRFSAAIDPTQTLGNRAVAPMSEGGVIVLILLLFW